MAEKDIEVMVDEAEVIEPPENLAESFRKKLGELKDLSDDQRSRLKKFLKEGIQEWKNDSSELHLRLEEDNDLVEGVVPETSFPWPGASNVHVPMTETYMQVYGSVEKRSILGVDVIWYGETDDEQLLDLTADVDSMMNYMARNVWNIEESIGSIFWAANRDGLAALQITWAEDFRPAKDILVFTNEKDFLNEFPTPEDGGMDEAQWNQLRSAVISQASEDFPLEVPIEFEKRIYNGCKGEVVEYINFVKFPVDSKSLDDPMLRGYGKRFRYRGGTIRDKIKDGIFYKEEGEALLRKTKGGNAMTPYRQSQNSISGIRRENIKDEYELYELVVYGKLDGKDGEEGKFLVTFSSDHDVLIQCIDYPYRVDFYAIYKIDERPNRMDGPSVPTKTRELNDEIDTQHNQRINTRTISTVPSFKALNNSKKVLDPMLQSNRFEPGVIFWLDDFDSFEQFKIQPTDLGESLQEEENDFRILDLYLGSAISLLSGGVAPGDKSAPGNKTELMISQSNLRMEEPINNLRSGVSQTGDICLSHLYQFGPPIIQFMTESATGKAEPNTIHKKFLRTGIRMKMKGINVLDNPEAEMNKKLQQHQVLMTEPLFAENANLRINSLRDALRAGRVPGRDKLLPTAEEIQQFMVQIQKQAILELQAEKQQQEQEAQANEVKGRLDQINQENKIRKVAETVVDRSLGGRNGTQ